MKSYAQKVFSYRKKTVLDTLFGSTSNHGAFMKLFRMKNLLLTSLLCPLLISAAEDDHVPVGERSQVTKENTAPATPAEPGQEEAAGFLADRYPPVYFPSSAHWMIGVSVLGDELNIEDGSVWKISQYDGYKALNWLPQDPLLITQNTRWFSKYTYRIINKNTKTSIEANLYRGPLKQGEHTLYITQLFTNQNELVLSDNSYWEISYFDQFPFRNWMVGDAIIIGHNSGFDSAYENILINVNMNHFIRAKQF